MVKLAASILTADFGNLYSCLHHATSAGIDWVHFDIMDNSFTNNLTFGSSVVDSLRKDFVIPFDIHLMVDDPKKYILSFNNAGADCMTIHYEIEVPLIPILKEITANNTKVGIALNPETPIKSIKEILPFINMVVVMSVNPGFGGQTFIHDCLQKVQQLKTFLKNEQREDILIEVDGGINTKNIVSLKKAGADICVVGSSVFNSYDSIENSVKKLKYCIV